MTETQNRKAYGHGELFNYDVDPITKKKYSEGTPVQEKHFLCFGSGIINFDIAEKELYQKAIEEFKEFKLFIAHPIYPEHNDIDNKIGLHINYKSGDGLVDLTGFWNIIAKLKKRLKRND